MAADQDKTRTQAEQCGAGLECSPALRSVVGLIVLPLATVLLFICLPGFLAFLLVLALLVGARLTRLVSDNYPYRFGSVFVLLFIVLPMLILVSDYLLIACPALLAIASWYVLAKIRGGSMLDRRNAVVGGPVLCLLVGFGLLMPLVPWLPCPSWCSRNVVKKADYRAMERIFGRQLPASFRISQVHYPGYSLVFNGPDGPLAATYEVIVEKPECDALIVSAHGEESPSKDGEWPGLSYQSQFVLKQFGNDWPNQYDENRSNGKGVPVPKVYRITCPVRGMGLSSLVTVDDRDSKVARLYLYTKVPYYFE